MPNRPKLIIEIQDDGSVRVDGCVNDKILAYGMLDAARDAIRDHIAKNTRRVMPVSLMPEITNGGRG